MLLLLLYRISARAAARVRSGCKDFSLLRPPRAYCAGTPVKIAAGSIVACLQVRRGSSHNSSGRRALPRRIVATETKGRGVGA